MNRVLSDSVEMCPTLPPKLKETVSLYAFHFQLISLRTKERMMHIQRWVDSLPVLPGMYQRPEELATASGEKADEEGSSGDSHVRSLPPHLFPPMGDEAEREPPPGQPYSSHFAKVLHQGEQSSLASASFTHPQLSGQPANQHHHHHRQSLNNNNSSQQVHQKASGHGAYSPGVGRPPKNKLDGEEEMNGVLQSGRNAVAHSRFFADWETRLIVRLFQDCFTFRNHVPSLADVRSRIAMSALNRSRTAVSVRSKIKRLQTTGAWMDFN